MPHYDGVTLGNVYLSQQRRLGWQHLSTSLSVGVGATSRRKVDDTCFHKQKIVEVIFQENMSDIFWFYFLEGLDLSLWLFNFC